MEKIFISYSRSDSAFADQLIQALQEKGHEIWFDRQDLRGGAAWAEEIARAIRLCEAFILVITPNSIHSDNVVREVSIADRHRRRIIPILYGQSQVPAAMEYQLAGLQVIQFTDQPFEEAVQNLDWALRNPPQKSTGEFMKPAVPAGKPGRVIPAYAPPPAGFPAAGTPTNPSRTAQAFALAAIGLGLLNLCTWAVSPWCWLPLSLTGVIAGFAGLRSDRKPLAIAGIVLNLLGLMALCGFLVFTEF